MKNVHVLLNCFGAYRIVFNSNSNFINADNYIKQFNTLFEVKKYCKSKNFKIISIER